MPGIAALLCAVLLSAGFLTRADGGLLNPVLHAATRRVHELDNYVHNVSLWCRSIVSDIMHNVRAPAEEITHQLRGVRASPVAATVTGAMGGIGRELVNLLSNHSVIQNSTTVSAWTRPEKLTALQDVVQRLGPHVRALAVDFAVVPGINGTEGAVDDLLTRVLDGAQLVAGNGSHRLDLLVHNAGLMATRASPRDIFAVNFYSPMFLSLAMLPHMLAGSRTPFLLFVGSSSHLRGAPPSTSGSTRPETSRLMSYRGTSHRTAVMGSYADAKLRLLLAATALERRFGPAGLTVRTAHPGLVDTPMLRGFFGAALAGGWRKMKFLRSETEGAAAVLLPALSHFDVIRWTPPVPFPHDYRRSYHVNGKPAPGKCSALVNDAAACEACLQDVVHEIRVAATAATRHRILTILKNAAPRIDSNAELPDEVKSRRKAALAALGRELED